MQVKTPIGKTAAVALDWTRHLRPPRSRTGVVVLAAVLVVVLGAGSGLFFWLRANTLPEGAAFAIGDEVVTVDELNSEVETLRALYGVQPPIDQPNKMADFRRRSAKAIAVSMILDRQAQQMGIGVPDMQVREVLDSYVVEELGTGPDARAQFVQALGNVGTSEQAVLDAIRRQLAVNEMFKQVTKGVTVKTGELSGEFPKYKDDLSTPERRRLSNIVVSSEQEAQAVVTQLGDGADFAELALEVSVDGATRNKGGDLGVVTAAQLQDTYAEAAFSTPAGQLFGPVHNQFGWNVGRVVEVISARPAVYEEVKDQLRTLVDFDRRLDRWNSWLGNAIKEADVRYADQYRPANPDAAPSSGPGNPSSGDGQPR